MKEIDRYKRALARVSRAFKKKGVDFVLIGSAILPIIYKVPYDPGDVDIHVVNKSTIADYGLFEEIARENDWDIGTNIHGMIYYELLVGDSIVRVDIVENLLDVYIPPQIVENAIVVEVDGETIKSIRLEDQLILKARSATDEVFLSEVARLIADPEVGIGVDREYMKKVIAYFPEDEQKPIAHRLERNGIYLD